MPVAAKSAQDRMIEYFVGAPIAEAVQTLKTAGVVVRARVGKAKPVKVAKRRGRPKKAVAAVAPVAEPVVGTPEAAVAPVAKKRGRAKKVVVTGAMPAGARPADAGV